MLNRNGHVSHVIRVSFVTGFGDKVRCFRCQGELKKWSVGAVPMEEHRKMFKHCVAVK